MGTRGAYGFRLEDGTEKITYNHYDSYPQVLGKEVATWVRDTPVSTMREVAARLELVAVESTPTSAQYDEISQILKPDKDVSTKNARTDWYCLLREAQGRTKFWTENPPLRFMEDNHHFLKDSLFCEWAYIVNLESNTFEVYRGFNQDREAPGRYAALFNVDDTYCGVALIQEERIAVLQEMPPEHFARWLKDLEVAEEDEEE